MPRNPIIRTVTLAETDTEQPLVELGAGEESLVASVDVTAASTNSNDITVAGDGENEFVLSPGETHVLDGVDLSRLSVSGTQGEKVKLFGNTI